MSRVICIKQRWITVQAATGHPTKLPEYEKVYTIDKMEYFHIWGTWAITLKELEPDQFYEIEAFRPLDESFPEWVENTILKDAEYEEATKSIPA